ncbi:AAA family ATPase [Paraburkholderia lacunae]|uniref:Flagellar biosynthesis protein FlhG n=1 Tax=Paraburkholderia lacunae TaxID=2211104 RepID=A0A370N894_9BURK|nr:AAA family ATPase [Paraburkholderia lacunae]RDK01802.1 flagellar biosynthesis protein FlhG [Paraburkholderia lacunae]
MDKFISDQAEGLRRLLAKSGSRVIAVTGGSVGVGRTTTVVNLAAALAQQGKDVLVIDECLDGNSVSAMLGGVRGEGNFAAVMRGEMTLDAAAARHALGFSMLAATRQSSAGLTAAQFGVVLNGSADIVLIDAELDPQGRLSPLAMQAHELMIVTRVAAQAITDAYACMKRLHYAHATAQFRVLVNHVQSVDDAHTAFANLAGVAGRYLTVALEDAGCIAADARMARALELSRCVVDAFPSTPAARDFRHLAAELQYWPMRPAMSSRAPWLAPATVTAAQHADQPSAQHA